VAVTEFDVVSDLILRVSVTGFRGCMKETERNAQITLIVLLVGTRPQFIQTGRSRLPGSSTGADESGLNGHSQDYGSHRRISW
jgi:hypothetical protein